MRGQTEKYFRQRQSAVRQRIHLPARTRIHTHTLSTTTKGEYSVDILNCRVTRQEGSAEESGGWAKWRQAAGRKPFTQTLNKVSQESFQLSAEEE